MGNRRLTSFKHFITSVIFVCVSRQSAATNSTTVRLCYHETLNASCTAGSVLMVDNAVYGRMQVGVCRTSDVHVGCWANVTSYVERHCSGRRRCDMTVANEMRMWAADNGGCPTDQLGYLRFTYYCLPVYEGDGRQRCSDGPLTVHSRSTYLASVVTAESRRGSTSCPWTIRVSRGQTVNVTLIDFTARNAASQYATCQIYGTMSTGASTEPTTICSRDLRQRVLHTHTGKEDVQIAIISSTHSHFLLHVEVRQTYGCAEYKSTEDQIVLYETTDTVLLRCVQNCARTWTLNCADGQWIATDGQEVDCTSRPSVIPSVGSATGSAADMGVVVGIAIGAFICGVVLSTVTMLVIYNLRVCTSNRHRTGVDENGYLSPQPSVAYIASHQADTASSSSPTTTATVAEPSSSEYCYVTSTAIQRQRRGINAGILDSDWTRMPANSPATNVDENGYLQPQPSVDDIASREATSASSSSPTTTTTVAEPQTAVQRRQPQDDRIYQPLQPQNDISDAQLYQSLRSEMP